MKHPLSSALFSVNSVLKTSSVEMASKRSSLCIHRRSVSPGLCLAVISQSACPDWKHHLRSPKTTLSALLEVPLSVHCPIIPTSFIKCETLHLSFNTLPYLPYLHSECFLIHPFIHSFPHSFVCSFYKHFWAPAMFWKLCFMLEMVLWKSDFNWVW